MATPNETDFVWVVTSNYVIGISDLLANLRTTIACTYMYLQQSIWMVEEDEKLLP